jgi:hypothetical protein
MNPNQEFVTVEAVGQAIGEVLGAFVTVINAMRRQPGFNDQQFTAELQDVMLNPNLTTLQSHTFSLLLKGASAATGESDSVQQN